MRINKNMYIFSGIFIATCFFYTTTAFASYAFSLDRFQLTGASNIDDHFNDNTLDSGLWDLDDPTVTESGTTVTFSNPGSLDQFSLGSYTISSEMSYISTAVHTTNWAGDFQATSTWNPDLPGLNQLFLMNISTGSGDEDIILGVSNWGPEMSSIFGTAVGPIIFFGRVDDIGSGDFDLQSISIDPSDVTGSILLTIAFADDADLFSGSFSLDGGSTITSFASTVASGSGGFISGDWSLGAESFDIQSVPIPSSMVLLLLGLSLKLFYKKE